MLHASLRNDLLSHCIDHDSRSIVQVQFLHEVGTVRFDGVGADIQDRSHLLVAVAFRKQLDTSRSRSVSRSYGSCGPSCCMRRT